MLLLHMRFEVRRTDERFLANFANIFLQLTIAEFLVVLELHVSPVESSIGEFLTAVLTFQFFAVVAFHVGGSGSGCFECLRADRAMVRSRLCVNILVDFQIRKCFTSLAADFA